MSEVDTRTVRVAAQAMDIVGLETDVVGLPYTDGLVGPASAVARALGVSDHELRGALGPGGLYVVDGRSRIGARRAAFLSVGPLIAFTHFRIRQFVFDLLRGLQAGASGVTSLGLTIHGVRYGENPERSLRAELGGCLSALRAGGCPETLRQVVIADRSPAQARRLQDLLAQWLPNGTLTAATDLEASWSSSARPLGAGPSLDEAQQPDAALVDALATAIHARFCDVLRTMGYRAGEVADAKARTHNEIKPFAELSRHEQDVYRQQGFHYAERLAEAGYAVRPVTSSEAAVLNATLDLDRLAEVDHRHWLKKHLDDGWRWAPTTDRPEKLHSAILPWRAMSRVERARLSPAEAAALGEEELPESRKRIVRETFQGLPELLTRAAYGAARSATNGVSYDARSDPSLEQSVQGRSPSVFISARSLDYTHAQTVFEFLTTNGVEAFFSKESLPMLGVADFRRQIDRALESAEHLIVVTSSAEHVRSGWVEAEWGFFVGEKRAGRKKGNLVTVVVGAMQAAELPPSLRIYEVIPFDGFRKVLHYVTPAVADDVPLRILDRTALTRRFRRDAWYLPDEDLLGFVQIPAGPFLMGSDTVADPLALTDELWPETPRGQGLMNLPTFYIARYPVTVAQFGTFVDAAGLAMTAPGPVDHPVIRVSWYEALDYCRWLENTLRSSDLTPPTLKGLFSEQWHVGLPSEAEWEKAARGGDGRLYPWGDGIDSDPADRAKSAAETMAVGTLKSRASAHGVFDLSGNVREWTRSLKRPYPYDPEDGREHVEPAGARVVRGGSFGARQPVRVALRGACDPHANGTLIGFRVALFRPGVHPKAVPVTFDD